MKTISHILLTAAVGGLSIAAGFVLGGQALAPPVDGRITRQHGSRSASGATKYQRAWGNLALFNAHHYRQTDLPTRREALRSGCHAPNGSSFPHAQRGAFDRPSVIRNQRTQGRYRRVRFIR